MALQKYNRIERNVVGSNVETIKLTDNKYDCFLRKF